MNTAVRRIRADIRELRKSPSDRYFAEPVEDNLFEWHFTLRGPPDTEFEGGVYHGRILLPSDYPFKPPNFVFLTPNGRFAVNQKICLSISAHHPEYWQPAWGIRLILEALISFFPTEGGGALGALDWPAEERRRLAAESRNFVCRHCGRVADLLTEPEDGQETPDDTYAAEIAQIVAGKTAPKPATPDAKTPDAETADAETADAETANAETPDAKTPDAKTPDAKTPDAKTPDAKTPDAKTPDAKTEGEKQDERIGGDEASEKREQEVQEERKEEPPSTSSSSEGGASAASASADGSSSQAEIKPTPPEALTTPRQPASPDLLPRVAQVRHEQRTTENANGRAAAPTYEPRAPRAAPNESLRRRRVVGAVRIRLDRRGRARVGIRQSNQRMAGDRTFEALLKPSLAEEVLSYVSRGLTLLLIVVAVRWVMVRCLD